ncbi:MAG TPA: GerMN domain-containing protein [Candidatus Deferrimicrobium sp.]|nr:GerMN domain-containing protein [Candidatus Deferrimicrobium sp.]
MKKILLILSACILVISSGCGILAPAHPTPAPTPTVEKPTAEKPTAENPGVEKPTPQAPVKVKVFLIALEDNGKSGKKLDTGDSLVSVLREISTPITPLRGAYEELLSLKDRNYGQSGLFNPLSTSDLKVDNISVQNGIATVNLSGQMSLGGVMDIPRVKGQLTETALQFSTIKAVIINVNGRKLDDVLSLK